ncbi:MAG TPA: hypothetical protein VFV20_03825 [Candidatus Limnocylindria bacterium]|nr:hypothetical protein [Candidatus Limnocylindria bacterium]
MKHLVRVLALAALVVSLVAQSTPASANDKIYGFVTDKTTGQVLADVCITLGPPIVCFTHTDAGGYFEIDLTALGATPGSQWELYFLKSGYLQGHLGPFFVNGPTLASFAMTPGTTPPPGPTCPAQRAGLPTQTVYLPNITRRLGGAAGWYTPFIVQNTGLANTDLEVSFYKFSDGSCVSRLTVSALKPGTSYSNDPNDNGKNPGLPDDSQFSVVVRSFGSTVVGIVNEHQGSGSAAEAMSYDGFTDGATTVYLPNITRRFFGFVTPFIIQNLGTATTSAVATFRPFDGSSGPITVTRSIDAGRAKPVDPNSNDMTLGAPGLVDGKQYSVTVTASQPIAVVVNTQNDAPGTATPMAASTDGVSAGAQVAYGSYAAKNASGRRTPIIVQNLGTAAITPTLSFTPLAGSTGTATTYTFPTIQPNASKAFDPRFSFDSQKTSSPALCSGASANCLGDGEYAFKVDGGTGALLAVQVNPESATTLMAYAGSAAPAAKYFLPNVTKSLCFCPTPVNGVGWTTPLLIQSVTATSATLKWYRFSDGTLVHTQTISLTPGSGVRIDPWSVSQLPADAQYSVVADAGTTGTITAIVTEFASGGDNAMAYEGFAAP